jgi:hypothetical protein
VTFYVDCHPGPLCTVTGHLVLRKRKYTPANYGWFDSATGVELEVVVARRRGLGVPMEVNESC